MTDADGELEDPDADADQEEADEDLPAIEEEERAEVDLDALAEDVEAEAGRSASSDVDPDPDDESSTDEDAESGDESEADELPTPEGETWGDLYVGTLTTLSNAVIEEHGKEGAEPIDEDLARELHLDEILNDWMATRGKPEDMPPGQALVLMTSVFLVVVVGSKTDLAEQLLEEVSL